MVDDALDEVEDAPPEQQQTDAYTNIHVATWKAGTFSFSPATVSVPVHGAR